MSGPAGDLGIALLGGGLDFVERAASRAEQAGFRSVWTTDFYERSAIVSLAVMARATRDVAIGSAIAYAVGRSPLVLASEARDLDELSGGRLILGLGTGTITMQRRWHSADFSHPAPRMEELVGLLRAFWAMDDSGVQHQGRFYDVDLVPTIAVRPPLRRTIPVYTSGVNPRTIETAGAVADGLVGHALYSRQYVDCVVRPNLAKGAARTGADPDAVKLAGMVICSVSEDPEQARREAKAQIAFYSLVRTYRIVTEVLGYEAAAAEMRSAWERRDHEGMIDATPDAILEQMAVAGTPDEVGDQLRDRFGGLYDHTLLYPPTFGVAPGRADENLDAILDVFGPLARASRA